MRTGRVAGSADEADAHTGADPHADPYVDAREVGVHAALPMAVRDGDEQAVAVAPGRPHDLTRPGRVYRCTKWSGEIDARVPAVAARPERIAEHRRRQRPRERQRNGRCGSCERVEGRRTGDAVRMQAGPLLELLECRVDVRAEDPVEVTGREAVLGEAELKRCDVPACVPEVQLPLPEAVTFEAAQCAACLGPDDSV